MVGRLGRWWRSLAAAGRLATVRRLLGRMNAAIRSLNWGMIAIGAPLGGLLADTAGYRAALWIGITGLAAAALALGLSRFREATLADALETVG